MGALPVGVPDTNPKSAHATFINEATGAVLGSTDLVKTGTSNGLAVWDNAGAPLPVTLGATADTVGVVIALGGLSSTTCGQPLVTCYDAGRVRCSPSGLPSKGIVHVSGWSAAGNGAQPNDPILRDVTLVPGSCVDPYFSSAASACTFGVRARARLRLRGDPLGAGPAPSVTATVGGTTRARSPTAYGRALVVADDSALAARRRSRARDHGLGGERRHAHVARLAQRQQLRDDRR